MVSQVNVLDIFALPDKSPLLVLLPDPEDTPSSSNRSGIVLSGVIANLRSGVIEAEDSWGLASNTPLSACWSLVAIVLGNIAPGVGMLEKLTRVCDSISRYLSKYECERRQVKLKKM